MSSTNCSYRAARLLLQFAPAALLALAATAHAAEPVSSDFRCLTDTGAKTIHLEFRMFNDPGSDWSGGYVRYKGAKNVVTVVPARTEALEKPAGRPWEFRTTWLEIIDGKVAGEYAVTTQGANIYGFDYRNLRNGKQFSFAQDVGATGDDACTWK
ncbi:MAG: hypothetical protein V4505_21455 [Pseudomonadota bacterium]